MRPLLPLLAAALATACNAGGNGPPASYCSTSADCPSSMVCEFSATAGCGAQGECGTVPDGSCGPAQTVCSCAGATTSTCVLAGYTLGGPVQALGACEAGGAADGAVD
jgi:hypothetical protein